MTKPRHPQGRVAGSKVCGDALSAFPDSAWYVNSNYGNANINHRNNQGFVRPVRVCAPPASECCGAAARRAGSAVTLRSLYDAFLEARRSKKPSINRLRFEQFWFDRLIDLQAQLEAGRWLPSPATCFIATRPKARQIHAPDFGDRVVHHWLVPQLEAIYEPRFCHDSYSNRRGKGTHAAVQRLRTFVRQVHSGQGGGWYLQLDIHNFFNSIHRPTLYAMLKRSMQRHGLPEAVQRAAHALLRHPIERQGVIHRSTAAERAQVPAHKRLENAAPGCGLPIGNYSSQFLANVNLDPFDQFVKRVLRVRRYLRYVDDFILIHADREQLVEWQGQIETFLRDRLRLRLKPDIRLRHLEDGIDFLGYVVYPTHVRVRPRVVRHAQAALDAWGRAHVRRRGIRATPADLRRLASTWASYAGHLRHADAHRLTTRLHARFPWLSSALRRRRFHSALEGKRLRLPVQHVAAPSRGGQP